MDGWTDLWRSEDRPIKQICHEKEDTYDEIDNRRMDAPTQKMDRDGQIIIFQ